MGQYGKKGIYNGYDKNHKEREALDYYATPPKEVTNILETLGLDLKDKTILEPSCGGGHMVEGIYKYDGRAQIIASDIMQRKNPFLVRDAVGDTIMYYYGTKYDFFSEDYPFDKADIVIMNPPFSIAAPFIIHGLEIATEKLIVFGRTKLVESKKRYEEIFSKFPPTDIYQYIDRVACAKNGDFDNTSAIEAHAWFIWDKQTMNDNELYDTKFHWIWSKK